MSVTKVVTTYARNAGADLSAGLHKLAKIDTDGDLVLAGAGEAIAGNIYEAAAQNAPVTVQVDGIGKCEAGGTITAGQLIASDASGLGVNAGSAGDYAIGIALESGVTGDIVPFVFARNTVHA